MHLVVVIPALNEAASIEAVVGAVPRTIDGIDSVEVIVVDDGSTDDTVSLASRAGAHVVSHDTNRGVGVAFRTGVEAGLLAGADVLVNMDGDGQFDPADIPRLLAPILAGRADVVTCTRFRDPALAPRMPWLKRAGNAAMTALVNRFTWGSQFTDVSCGFRAYTRDTLLRLRLFGDFTYTQESFVHLVSQHLRIEEVPLAVRGTREHGKSRVAGSLTRYAAHTLPILLRAVRDHRPLYFFGGLGLWVLGSGIALGLFVFGHWLATGHTSPYRSVLLGSGLGILVGCLMLFAALIADMLNRVRLTQEELLYLERRRLFGAGRGGADAQSGDQPPAGGGGR